MLQALIFDFDNTLIDFDKSEVLAIQTFFSELGVLIPDNEEILVSTFLAENSLNWKKREEIGLEEVFNKTVTGVLKHVLPDIPVPKSIGKTYLETFEGSVVLESGARSLLENISSRYPLFIVSNGLPKIQRNRIENSGIAGFFRDIIVSGDVGVSKPSRAIFDLIIESHHLNRKKTIYIGDSLSNDYYGSKNANIDFCFYNRERIEFAENVDFHITELSSLLDILE